MRIGVLGGSFDPVHNGHLILARLALEQLGLDRVHFTVAGVQPLKQGAHVAGPAHRLRMVELALDGIPGLVADGRELRRPPPSYTIDTLREIAAAHPGAELVLIMGSDVAAGFGRWREPAAVRVLAQIAVCPRPVADGTPGVAPPAFDVELRAPAIDISSTAIRGRAGAGLPLAGWVPPAVADYIVASQLYRSFAG